MVIFEEHIREQDSRECRWCGEIWPCPNAKTRGGMGVAATIKPSAIDYFGTGNDAGDYSFLSNFYKSGRTTVEHHYQAAKTDDPVWAALILAAPTPGQAKRQGRRAPMRPTWDDEKDTVMLVLLRLKFSNPDLAARLLATGDAELIEGNTWGDTYWGVCNGVGENRLGKLLMRVREELRARGPVT